MWKHPYRCRVAVAMVTAVALSTFWPLPVAADEALSEDTRPLEEGFEKVGGDYVVTSIEKLGDRSFRIIFRSAKPTGAFDELVLESDHVHVAVKEGQTLRLSAEVLQAHGARAEVAQVMLFLPNRRGPVPVWLLSNKAPTRDLRSSKYLDMHVPLGDYLIL